MYGICPDSSAEVSGFESCAGCCGVDIYHAVLPNWVIVIKVSVYGCIYLKDPLETIRVVDCLPVLGSVYHIKGYIKLQSTNQI